MAKDNLIYFRMFGYIVTVIMHVSNIIYMEAKLSAEEAQKLFKDPTIKFFNDNQARYFTCWTFFLQIVYAIVGLTCDVISLRNSNNKQFKLPKILRGFRDTMFSAIQWPSTFLVALTFWSLYTWNREIILPKILDKVLTWESNHVIHTCIVPVMLWEIVFRPRTEPRSHRRNLVHLTFYYILYFSVLFFTYYEKGTWIYPVFAAAAGTIYFPLFMLAIYLSFLFYYYMQWPITRFIHGSVEKSKLR